MPATFKGALTALRTALNDAGDGTWSLAEKILFLNKGRRETVLRTNCHEVNLSIPVVDSQHTYSADPIYRISNIRLGDEEVRFVQVDSLAVIQQNWDALPTGTPTKYIPLSGGILRVSPTPGPLAAGIVEAVDWSPAELEGNGYVVGDILNITTHTATGDLAQVVVTAIGAGGALSGVQLYSVVDGGGARKYKRGSGYTVGAHKATSAFTGTGVNGTVAIVSVCEFEVQGAANVYDITCGVDVACTTVLASQGIAATGHGLSGGMAVVFGDTGEGVTVGRVYYVLDNGNLSADHFQVSETPGGPTVTITGNGSTTFNVALVEIPQGFAEEAVALWAEAKARWARLHILGNYELGKDLLVQWEAKCRQIEAARGGTR